MHDKLAWNRVFTPFQAIANGSGVIDRRGVEQKIRGARQGMQRPLETVWSAFRSRRDWARRSATDTAVGLFELD